jgi:hypothetical protein
LYYKKGYSVFILQSLQSVHDMSLFCGWQNEQLFNVNALKHTLTLLTASRSSRVWSQVGIQIFFVFVPSIGFVVNDDVGGNDDATAGI